MPVSPRLPAFEAKPDISNQSDHQPATRGRSNSSSIGSLLFGGENASRSNSTSYIDERKARRHFQQSGQPESNSDESASKARGKLHRPERESETTKSSEYFANGLAGQDGEDQQRTSKRFCGGARGRASSIKLG